MAKCKEKFINIFFFRYDKSKISGISIPF